MVYSLSPAFLFTHLGAAISSRATSGACGCVNTSSSLAWLLNSPSPPLPVLPEPHFPSVPRSCCAPRWCCCSWAAWSDVWEHLNPGRSFWGGDPRWWLRIKMLRRSPSCTGRDNQSPVLFLLLLPRIPSPVLGVPCPEWGLRSSEQRMMILTRSRSRWEWIFFSFF